MSELTNEQAWYLLEYISLGDEDAIDCDDYEFIGCDEFGNEGEYTESITKIAGKADSYIKELYDQNKQLQSKIAALSIAVADNDIDEVKRLLPLSGEQVTNELNAKVGRLEDQLIRLQARLQERFEFVLGDIGTDLQAEYERSLDIINESGSQALSEIKADTVNNLFFPVAIRKMWTGYEVNLWLSEQAKQLRNPEQEKV